MCFEVKSRLEPDSYHRSEEVQEAVHSFVSQKLEASHLDAPDYEQVLVRLPGFFASVEDAVHA